MPEPVPTPMPVVYEGSSTFFRVTPWLLVFFALALTGAGQFVVAAAFGMMGVIVSSLLPWHFAISGEGVLLTFALRDERFYSRHDVAVQVDGGGGAVLLPTRSARRGYLLVDGVLGTHRWQLRAALQSTGFRLVEM